MRARATFPPDPRNVPEHALRLWAGLPTVHRQPRVLAGLVEALSNAVVHGALGIGPRGDSMRAVREHIAEIERRTAQASGRVVVEVEGTSTIQIRVRDPGDGFDWRSTRVKPGHGLSIMRAAFDDVTFNERGNEVCLVLDATRRPS